MGDVVVGVLDRVRLTAIGRPHWWFVSEGNKPEDLASLRRRFDELEHAVAQRVEETCAAVFRTPQRTAGAVQPAWRRRTRGERRWQVAACTAVAIGLQVAVPGRLAVLRPVWILPALQGILLLTLLVANPHRIDRESRVLRILGLTLAALISFANAWSLVSLAAGLVRGTEGQNAGPLLVTGGAIWLTNIIVFGLWYWEFDRGGPVARALGTRPYPDFQFVQMTSPQLAPPDWEPAFADYLYLAFTNAAAFSPTDVRPLSRWAKLAMTLQSVISIVTVAGLQCWQPGPEPGWPIHLEPALAAVVADGTREPTLASGAASRFPVASALMPGPST